MKLYDLINNTTPTELAKLRGKKRENSPRDKERLLIKVAEIEDKFNYKKLLSADINIKLREYEFFAKKVSEKSLLPGKETGDISIELKTLGDISKLKYKLRLVSDSKDENNGYFMFRGKRINYNDDFYLTDNFDKITYHPTGFGTGKHQISFQLKDITGQAPKNNVGSISFDIYKPMELKSLKFDRTWQKIVHNDFVKPIYNMEYFVSYDLEMSSKLKSVVIRGYDKRNGKNFELPLDKEEIKNPVNNFKFESVNRKTGPQDVFEPGDELTIIFTDDRDMTLTVKSKMKAKE